MLNDGEFWWWKRSKPLPTSQNCRQHISSPTSVTHIDVAYSVLRIHYTSICTCTWNYNSTLVWGCRHSGHSLEHRNADRIHSEQKLWPQSSIKTGGLNTSMQIAQHKSASSIFYFYNCFSKIRLLKKLYILCLTWINNGFMIRLVS